MIVFERRRVETCAVKESIRISYRNVHQQASIMSPITSPLSVSPVNTNTPPSIASQDVYVGGILATAMYDYDANGDEEASMREGESVVVIESDGESGRFVDVHSDRRAVQRS